MPNMQGFEVVVEASEHALRNVLRSSWDTNLPSDACDHPGAIPAVIDLQPGIVLAGYTLERGRVDIPREDLDLRMWPAGNGIELTLGLNMHLAIRHPPVPSAGQLELRAVVHARIPIDAGGIDNRQVIVRLHDLPRANVQATLTSGDPLAPMLGTLLAEVVHRAYAESDPARGGTYPTSLPRIEHTVGPVDVTCLLGPALIRATAVSEIDDDPDDPHYAITTRYGGNLITLSIPVYLHIDEIRPAILATALDLRSPMGVETRIVITAPFNTSPGCYTARLSAATMSVGALYPVPAQEGRHYTSNRGRWRLLDQVIYEQIQAYGMSLLQQLGDISMEVPTVAAIEALIGDVVHEELVRRRSIAFWTPDLLMAGFSVKDITVQALPDALAIALNAGDAAPGAELDNFIPAERDFAAAISGACVKRVIAQACVNRSLTLTNRPGYLTGNGSAIVLTTLDVAVIDQVIRTRGAATVKHAIPGNRDVAARFHFDLGLRWATHDGCPGDGTQMLEPHIHGYPVVYPQGLVGFWVSVVILALIALSTVGQLGSLIILILALMLRLITIVIGGRLVRNSVSEVGQTMLAWPPDLMQIGPVQAIWSDSVVIDPSGITIAGDFTTEVLIPKATDPCQAPEAPELLPALGRMQRCFTQSSAGTADGIDLG